MIVHPLKMCTNDAGPEQSLVLFFFWEHQMRVKENKFDFYLDINFEYSRSGHWSTIKICSDRFTVSMIHL